MHDRHAVVYFSPFRNMEHVEVKKIQIVYLRDRQTLAIYSPLFPQNTEIYNSSPLHTMYYDWYCIELMCRCLISCVASGAKAETGENEPGDYGSSIHLAIIFPSVC
jgi:hypothetical protein